MRNLSNICEVIGTVFSICVLISNIQIQYTNGPHSYKKAKRKRDTEAEIG